jgi:hypothetical protein
LICPPPRFSLCLRRYGKEVGSVLPVNRLGTKQPQVRFMHQGRGLQGMIATLPPHLPRCNLTQIPYTTSISRFAASGLPVRQSCSKPVMLCAPSAIMSCLDASLRYTD